MPCECPEPGWCNRHQCRKPPHWHKLCSTQPDYFEAWEAGQGPGQTRLHPPVALNKEASSESLKVALPCLHRGETTRHVICQLCGRRGQRVEVMRCAIHGECTLRRWGTSIEASQLPNCLTCPDRGEGSN